MSKLNYPDIGVFSLWRVELNLKDYKSDVNRLASQLETECFTNRKTCHLFPAALIQVCNTNPKKYNCEESQIRKAVDLVCKTDSKICDFRDMNLTLTPTKATETTTPGTTISDDFRTMDTVTDSSPKISMTIFLLIGVIVLMGIGVVVFCVCSKKKKSKTGKVEEKSATSSEVKNSGAMSSGVTSSGVTSSDVKSSEAISSGTTPFAAPPSKKPGVASYVQII